MTIPGGTQWGLCVATYHYLPENLKL